MDLTYKFSRRGLDAIAERRPRIRRAIETTGREIEREAKERAPVKTGALRRSIGFTMESDTAGIVRVGQPYGVHIEYGTRYMGARPFLTPAVELQRQPFVKRIKDAVYG